MDKFIEREPSKDEYPRIILKNLNDLEKYLQKNDLMINIDLSHLDFSSSKGQKLLFKINEYDDKTTWPTGLIKEKAYQLECGKDSGLGISSLHKKGYTGKGINIAIIDQCLLVNHPEYKRNVQYYKELGNEEFLKKYGRLPGEGNASYHGPAVASLAVGTHCGSAPEAGLVFISEGWRHSPELALTGLKYLIRLNKKLPEKDKIRCLSCSWGRGAQEADFTERMALFKELEETGCMVFGGFYGVYVGRRHTGASKIQQDSDTLDNLQLDFWDEQHTQEGDTSFLIVPEHQRTYACATGGYLYGERGGASWTYPYLAGLVACALQANPDLLKERGWQNKIWQKLLETGRETPNHKGKIVQPEAFVMSVLSGTDKTLKKTLQNGEAKTHKKMKGNENE